MHEEVRLSMDPDAFSRLVYALDASVNVEILQVLARARRRGDGWMYLSEIAKKLGQSAGTVAAAAAKLGPLVEERRDRGRRYFRATYRELRLVLDRPR